MTTDDMRALANADSGTHASQYLTAIGCLRHALLAAADEIDRLRGFLKEDQAVIIELHKVQALANAEVDREKYTRERIVAWLRAQAAKYDWAPSTQSRIGDLANGIAACEDVEPP